MKSSFYPPADRTTQWWEKKFDRGYFTKIEKILLHTTETSSWPDYDGGAKAPTLTYYVKTRKWRQHNYLDTSARALGDPASTPVRENRDNVIQIEIIWYAAKAKDLPDTAYRDLAAFIAYVREEWGGPNLVTAAFVGNSAAGGAHMTSAQYDAFNGILGHQHAPSPSTHWDPGAINGALLLKYVRELENKAPVVTPPPTPATPVDPLKPKPPAGIPNPNTYQIYYHDALYSPYWGTEKGKANPFWTMSSYFSEIYRQNETIIEQNKQIIDLLKAQGS